MCVVCGVCLYITYIYIPVRQLCCFYWTFAEYPSWFRSRRWGWYVLGLLRTDVLKKIPGNLTGLYKHILQIFWSANSFNFLLGIKLKHCNHEVTCQAKPLCFIADAKAQKETSGLKGCGVLKCCGSCQNVCNCDPQRLEGQNYLVHYTATRDKFHANTHDSFMAIANSFRTMRDALSKTAFEEFQKAVGLVYVPAAWYYDDYLSQLISPVSGLYWDPQHTICSSSGIQIYIHTYTYIYICIYICIHVSKCMCMCFYQYIYICVNIYTYIHI